MTALSRFQEPDETTFDADIDRALTAAYEDGAGQLIAVRDALNFMGLDSAADMVADDLNDLVFDDDDRIEDAVREIVAKPSYDTLLEALDALRNMVAREQVAA